MDSNFSKFFALACPISGWCAIAIFLQKTLTLKMPVVIFSVITPLIGAVLITIQQFFMLIVSYNYFEPDVGLQCIYYINLGIQILMLTCYFNLAYNQIITTWNLEPLYFPHVVVLQTVVFFLLILAPINYSIAYQIFFFNIFKLLVFVLYLSVQIYEFLMLNMMNVNNQHNFFLFKSRQSKVQAKDHLYKIPQSSLNKQSISKSFLEDREPKLPDQRLYRQLPKNIFPKFQGLPLIIFIFNVITLALIIYDFYLQIVLIRIFENSSNLIKIYQSATNDKVKWAYALVEAQKSLVLFDKLYMYVPILFAFVCSSVLAIFVSLSSKPKIENVFENEVLFKLFAGWLYFNRCQNLLLFLQDSFLLKTQFTIDTTTANIIFIKYQDLVQSGELSISRHAFNQLDKNLNLLQDSVQTMFFEDDDEFIQEEHSSEQSKQQQTSNDTQGQTYRKKQRQIINHIFYCAELEASFQLCYLAHVFLEKDTDKYLQFIYKYATKSEQFKELMFGKPPEIKTKKKTIDIGDLDNFYNQNDQQKQDYISDLLDFYQPIVKIQNQYLPDRFNYAEDANILSFLQKFSQISQHKHLHKAYLQFSQQRPHSLIQAKHSPVVQHIVAMQSVLQIFEQQIQNLKLPEDVRNQLEQTLAQSVLIDKIEIQDIQVRSQICSDIDDEIDPTMLFNEPQFADFDTEEKAEITEEEIISVLENDTFEEKQSMKSFSPSFVKSNKSSKQYLAIQYDTTKYLQNQERIKECQQVYHYMQTLFSDSYPENIRTPLNLPEIEIHDTVYQFDMQGHCKLSILQDSLYHVLLYINDVLKNNDTYHKVETKEYDIDKFLKYVQQYFFRTTFDARQIEYLSKGHCALAVTFLAIKYLDIDVLLQIPDTALFACLYELEQGYTPTLYHNRLHIADFVQMVFLQILAINAQYSAFVKQTSFEQSASQREIILSPTDIFSLIMAACCHDFGHTGIDNPFCINSQNVAAIIYNDIGPMEQAHASLSWGLVSKFSTIFLNWSVPQFREFRIKFIELVLATDMTFHFPFVQKITKISSNYLMEYFDRFKHNKINQRDQIFKWFVMKCIMKFGDLANPTRSFPVAEYWAYSYINEQRITGDIMRELNWPPNLILNPNKRDLDFLCGSQIGFVNFVLRPFLGEINRLVFKASTLTKLDYCLYAKLQQNMVNTSEIWEERNAKK
ncbi:Phosphodiesterase [Spironucleus salmonicida]|uniref:Phosphodiesterase n=1 Tax=Spironucleus salmonicida TaxID=348837 RepID=V6LP05_9EUKA|nr:Phosphodiesterase [Spironucleus salmonicida]|eukprot:EST45973.1 cAMP-specific 3',5'-cyclic phosphodiesterase 4B [Spironucleus salmonicida]